MTVSWDTTKCMRQLKGVINAQSPFVSLNRMKIHPPYSSNSEKLKICKNASNRQASYSQSH